MILFDEQIAIVDKIEIRWYSGFLSVAKIAAPAGIIGVFVAGFAGSGVQ